MFFTCHYFTIISMTPCFMIPAPTSMHCHVPVNRGIAGLASSTTVQAPNCAMFCISWHNGFHISSQGICTRSSYLKHVILCDARTPRITRRRQVTTTTASISALLHDNGQYLYQPHRGGINSGSGLGCINPSETIFLIDSLLLNPKPLSRFNQYQHANYSRQ